MFVRAMVTTSVVAGALASAGPLAPVAAAAQPRVERHVIASAAVGSEVRVAVVRPVPVPREEPLPLVLLLHGLGGSEQTWLDPGKGDAAGLAERHPAVYATFDAGDGFYSDWYNGGARGTPAYERFVLDELLPFLRRTYRLRGGRAHRTVVGTSMGGYGALLLAARRPDVFGRAVSLSGFVQPQRPFTYPGLRLAAGVDAHAIWGPPSGPYLDGHNPTKLLDTNLRPVRIHLTAGDGVPRRDEAGAGADLVARAVNEREVRAQAEELVAARGAASDVTWRPRRGVHGWASWRHDLAAVLAWGLGGPVGPKPTSWTYDTVAQRGRAWDVAFRFARPPATVHRLRRDGRILRVDGDGVVQLVVRGCRRTARLPTTLVVPGRGCRGPQAGR